MKVFQKLLCAWLCLALAVFLAACDGKTETPSSSSLPESSAASSEPSVPEPESSRFVPADDLIPSSAATEEDPFLLAFSQNPIDKQYDKDYSLATSFSMMRQTCDEAARRWKNMADIAYQAALQAAPEEDRAALEQEQDEWLNELDGRIESIRSEAGDSNEGILSSAKQVVLLYRERAMALCRVKYEADGSLPEFPDPAQESAPAAG